MKTLAEDKPLDWARFVQTFAHLAGYSTKTEIKKDINVVLNQMTDQQIDEAITKIERGEVIDITDYVEMK